MLIHVHEQRLLASHITYADRFSAALQVHMLQVVAGQQHCRSSRRGVVCAQVSQQVVSYNSLKLALHFSLTMPCTQCAQHERCAGCILAPCMVVYVLLSQCRRCHDCLASP